MQLHIQSYAYKGLGEHHFTNIKFVLTADELTEAKIGGISTEILGCLAESTPIASDSSIQTHTIAIGIVAHIIVSIAVTH